MPNLMVKIDASGALQFIWNDKLLPIFDAGVGRIRRASMVEPNEEGKWEADLSPVEGPTLGPFVTRQEALEEEISWLETNLLGVNNARN